MHLGDLEKAVLQYLWRVDSVDAKAAHEHFKKHRGGSLNTIQSTLDRLYKKKLLVREKISHAFHYRAAMSQADFIAQLIKETAEPFANGDEENLLAAFVSLSASLSTDRDEDNLARLENLIRDYRKHNQSS